MMMITIIIIVKQPMWKRRSHRTAREKLMAGIKIGLAGVFSVACR